MEYLGDEAMTVKSFLDSFGSFEHPSKFPFLSKVNLYSLGAIERTDFEFAVDDALR